MDLPYTHSKRVLTTIGICAFASLVFPGVALAAFETPCRRPIYEGRVKVIVVTETKVDPLSGLPVGLPTKHSEITFSQDGRTSTFTRFETDTLEAARQKMFPSATSEYNSAGLLTKEVYVFPSRSHQRVTTCEYDRHNRVVKQTTIMINPEASETLEFEYGDGWRRQHFRTAVAEILVSQVVDAKGNVVSEEERDERSGTLRSRTTFTYRPGEVERCAIGDSGVRFCRTTIRDSHGNEVEVRSGDTFRRDVYEYDSVGNWITKKTTGNGALAQSSTDTVIRRAITYW